MTNDIGLEQVHSDDRGSITVIRQGPKEIATITLNSDGAIRGGHSHPYDSYTIIFNGVVDYIWADSESKPSESRFKRFDSQKENIINVPKNVPHLLVSVGESIISEMKKGFGLYATKDYNPYRNIIKLEKRLTTEEIVDILRGQ